MSAQDSAIFTALTTVPDEYRDIGKKIGHLFTDFGLPIDMALERLDLTRRQKIVVLHGALGWLIEHRRNSNATDKAVDRQRKTNREVMRRFIATGEAGVY